MTIPKCKECEDYRVSWPPNTCATNHYCCNPQILTVDDRFLKHIPRDEMDGDSPKWCPKRSSALSK